MIYYANLIIRKSEHQKMETSEQRRLVLIEGYSVMLKWLIHQEDIIILTVFTE